MKLHLVIYSIVFIISTLFGISKSDVDVTEINVVLIQ